MSIRIAVSLRGQMRALASQGIFATDCYSQLHTILLQKLGPAHAALLAEPQHDSNGQSVDWYYHGPDPAVPPCCLRDLPEAEAGAIRARAGELARGIQAFAAQQTDREISAQLLRLALQHPAEEDLWAVDGQPVLINWGFAPGTVGAQPQDLTRLGAAPPPPPPPPPLVPAAPSPAGGCLPWLLPLLLLALLLWLLLAALGLAPSPLPASCFRLDESSLLEEKNRAAQLDDELAALWRQLQERAALCKPPAPKAEPPKPEPEVVEPFLGETPPEPEPAPPVEKPKKPERPAEKPKERPKPKKNEDLSIPDDAAKKNDLAFLEGCWTSETGLFSHPSREPIIAEYCFDKNGKGRRFVRERNGQVCSGPARARFNGDRLQFNADGARCPRGGSYVPQKVDCTGRESSTQCKGNELGGSNNKWDARFKRK